MIGMASPQQAEVRSHYRQLAGGYNARANQTCERSYRQLMQRHLKGRGCLLELGSGSSDMLNRLAPSFGIACDLSIDMLRQRDDRAGIHCLVSAGERLPFPGDLFDGVFLINVLEHVSDVGSVLAESARVLKEGGLWVAVTPNGNWEFWLDLAERWSLKLPEGPHTFLTARRLAQAVREHLEVLEHRTFLVLPAGPPGLARVIDRLTCCSALGWGFFQYLVARKPTRP
jgi:ubiquinone/menaquinone biosynthesis C-methylase UbiE